MTNLITQENIDKCLEYSDYKTKLKSLISELKISANFIEYNTYFDHDTEPRNIYRINISRNNKRISFKFGQSIVDTMENKEPDLYSILCCVGSEYMYNPLDFNEFCDEYGYDQDSISALKTYKRCIKMDNKLRKIFDDQDIEIMPR